MFCLISDDMQYDVRNCKQLTAVQSDHSPIIIRISSISDEQPRGRGYWKFNNLLTQDKVFVKTLKENINEWVSVSDEQQDPRVNWEFLKHKIFRFSEQYANEQAEKRKAKRVSLEEKVQQLEQQIVDSETPSETLTSEYENTKKELERIYDYITSGIIFRSKMKWYEEGEKNTQYIFSLEKRNKTKSHIRKLIGQTDDELTSPKSIHNEIKSIYSNLYSRKSVKTNKSVYSTLHLLIRPSYLKVKGRKVKVG